MSHLFSVPTRVDSRFCEGVVTEVDPIRLFCKVKTTKAQNLVEVAWMMPSGGSSRGGTLFIPTIGDRVIVNTSLGYPIIMGYLPKISVGEIFSTEVDTGQPEVDTGDFSPLSNGLTVFGEKTGDAVAGDQIITSEGGAVVGALRGGTVLLKSSRLAQIIITKWDELVRIVARNYEVFSDQFTDVAVNVRGRIYRFTGYGQIAEDARNDFYPYMEFFGDTALGEQLKGDYIGADPNTFVSPTAIIKKELVQDAALNALQTRTVDSSGVVEEKVQNIGGTAVTTIKHDSGTITLKYNDTAIVTITPTNISIDYNSQSTIVIDADSVVIDHSGGGHVVIDDLGVNSTMGAHFVTLDAAGVHLG